jgi:hypothetical protein
MNDDARSDGVRRGGVGMDGMEGIGGRGGRTMTHSYLTVVAQTLDAKGLIDACAEAGRHPVGTPR